jgi:hypothetical protein
LRLPSLGSNKLCFCPRDDRCHSWSNLHSNRAQALPCLEPGQYPQPKQTLAKASLTSSMTLILDLCACSTHSGQHEQTHLKQLLVTFEELQRHCLIVTPLQQLVTTETCFWLVHATLIRLPNQAMNTITEC